ncbi:S41 family peptidase [Olivibacter sp. SDN3]|uniref:S41 family peptidase n=1 Tax=Olivibacter sp. SDN3 TaxID=2764720 RepID=UPI00165175CA|nr:S41 family peptidase [Olivibacter sp. SDN3]QNL48118.1 S41 family peptidase [Olivibacter sp. SDN3]
MLTHSTRIFYTCILFISISLSLNLDARGQSKLDTTLGNHEALAVYVGKYAISPNFVLTFQVVNGELTVVPPGQQPIPIIQINDHTFADKKDKNVQMIFVLNDNGSIVKVILNQHGEKIEAQRLEASGHFSPDKMYSAEQLKADLSSLKNILSENHPRPFEFTAKEVFEHSYDSLLASINQPMNEIAFRYLLMPLVAKIHCGHTRIDPSSQFQRSKPSKFSPFVLYYEGERAFVRYSAVKDLPIGSEVKSINSTPIMERIQNLLARTIADGIHPDVQYYLINQPMSWFLGEMPYWYGLEDYNLDVIDTAGQHRNLNLKAIDEPTFKANMPPPLAKRHQLHVLENKKAAVLSYPTLDFPDTSIRNRFLEETFTKLRSEGVDRLILDLRGNGGGSPHHTAYLLKYLIPHEFTYSNVAPLPDLDGLKRPIASAENHFNGKVYVLIDGGCFSSTGHLLSLLRYHKIGTFVGEKSASSYSCNTNGIPYTLSNTGLTLFCPKYVYETAVNGFQRAEGISPDYTFKQTLSDILSGKDIVMEQAINMAEKETQ